MTTYSTYAGKSTAAPYAGRWLSIALGAALFVGPVGAAWADAIERGVTFAAHDVHGGLVVDHWAGGAPGELQPASWFRWPGGPSHVLRTGGTEGAALWLGAPGRATVRSGPTTDAPITGRVEPSWDDNAIRLTITPAVGPPIRSDVFTRLDLGAGPDELSRITTQWALVRGTYQAALRTPDGKQVGWLRAQVGLHQDGFVGYEGVLPATVDQGLAAGAASALGSEIYWIAERTIDVPKRW